MKRIVMALVLILAVCSMAMAQETISIIDTVKKLPGLKQGVAYSLIDNEISYLSTVELIKGEVFSVEAGYSSENKAVGVISMELLNLKKLGVTLPVADLIDLRVGVWGGYGSINSQELDRSEWNAGVCATVISVKF